MVKFFLNFKNSIIGMLYNAACLVILNSLVHWKITYDCKEQVLRWTSLCQVLQFLYGFNISLPVPLLSGVSVLCASVAPSKWPAISILYVNIIFSYTCHSDSENMKESNHTLIELFSFGLFLINFECIKVKIQFLWKNIRSSVYIPSIAAGWWKCYGIATQINLYCKLFVW